MRTTSPKRIRARHVERLKTNTGEITPGDEQPAARGREVDPADVPSPEEVKRLLVAAEPGLFKTFLMTDALTGARSGELLALTWNKVDLGAEKIHIHQAVTWART